MTKGKNSVIWSAVVAMNKNDDLVGKCLDTLGLNGVLLL